MWLDAPEAQTPGVCGRRRRDPKLPPPLPPVSESQRVRFYQSEIRYELHWKYEPILLIHLAFLN